MNNSIKVIPMDYEDNSLFQTISRWHNQENIKKNFCLNFSKEDSKKIYVASEMQLGFKNDALKRFIITFNDEVVGHCNYAEELPAKKFKNSLWIGILIAETKYKSQGIGRFVMNFFEEKAKELKLDMIEFGVYSYNTDAIKFYEKLGYKHFDKDVGVVHWDGQVWDALRMNKCI